MALTAGTRLGPYEVVGIIGAGGMGEVYRARDTKLNREVALKVLLPEVATDPERLARFAREAQVLAALNHPHIAHIYGLEDSTGTPALVMELVEGPTLADRIARGAIPLDDALAIAKQIADALEAAHEQGIIHRDLKPANIKIKDDGTVKVLDFGLAKALDGPGAGGSSAAGGAGNNLSMSPTITTPAVMTGVGVILGTAAYMSPEQAKGRPADRRSDIWAFGCVLYETLTGARAFGGDDVADTLAHVLRGDPQWTALPPLTPPPIVRLLHRCLEKDPRQRLADVSSVRLDIRDASSPPPFERSTTTTVPRRRRGWMIAAAIVVTTLAGAAAAWRWHVPAPADPISFTIAPPADATFATPPGGGTGLATQVAISPDGRHVAFVANDQNGYQLWVRTIAGLDAHPIADTQGATFPFWSPDSHHIGFFAGGKLKRVSLAGGIPTVLCDAVAARGGSWSRDNVILFTPNTSGVLLRVSAAGGTPVEASSLDTTYGETSHRFPWFLPDGRHFLYTASIGTCCPASKTGRIKVGVLDSKESKTLMQAESTAVYTAGYVLFKASDRLIDTLMAQPFDAASQKPNGDAFPVAQGIAAEGSRYTSLSASDTGVLVYAGGVGRSASRLTWFDRSGRALGGVGSPAPYMALALSSDEHRVAVADSTGTPENTDLFIFDEATKTQTRFTFDPNPDIAPIWSPDDRQILFRGLRNGASTLLRKAVNGTTTEETLLVGDTKTVAAVTATDWSLDNRYILYSTAGVGASQDVWALPLFGDRKPIPVLQTPALESDAMFSPDGKWIVYSATENAQSNVFVQPFPPTGGKNQISPSGGLKPIWSRDGKEIFYESPDNKLMAVTVDTSSGFQARSPQTLFPIIPITTQAIGSVGRQYAVTRDRQRFLVNVVQQQSATTPLTVVVNWPSTIQK